MTAKDAIKTALIGTQSLVPMYLSELSDADLLVRPAPRANHIAWQLGHVISSEVEHLSGQLPGAQYPELPAGFAAQHRAENSVKEQGFCSRQQYLDLFQKVRQATLANVDRLADADLDRANTGPLSQFAPTIGALLLVSNHTLMHAGQFTVVRRLLGKPVIF
jgi:hypothetical protein